MRIQAILVAATLMIPTRAPGQSYGLGDSPGRAAYRTEGHWNNGPFYTVPHWNPYAPHRASTTYLFASQPLAPPWSTAPHGLFTMFTPERGALYPYAEGFSPYSGFSGWYARTYRIEPTREVVQNARAMFFRSAPRPPAGFLPPLPPARPYVRVPATARATPGRGPANAPKAAPRAAIPIYRSSVAGMP